MLQVVFKKIFALICGITLTGCEQSKQLSPAQFTEAYVKALKQAAPQYEINVVAPLELKVKGRNGHETSSFLDNAYNSYRLNPQDRDSIIGKYVSAFVESPFDSESTIDRTRIVPIIKDKAYLQEVRQSMATRVKKPAEFMDLHEEYNSELTIFYAEDSPKNMRFLSQKDLADLKIEKGSLRALAVENLIKIISKPKLEGGNGLFILQAGGDYDASLILLDKIWSTGQIKVEGDIVVALPSRDLLLVTGTGHKEAVAKVRDIAKKTVAEAPYRLTPELFVYRNGKFEVFRK